MARMSCSNSWLMSIVLLATFCLDLAILYPTNSNKSDSINEPQEGGNGMNATNMTNVPSGRGFSRIAQLTIFPFPQKKSTTTKITRKKTVTSTTDNEESNNPATIDDEPDLDTDDDDDGSSTVKTESPVKPDTKIANICKVAAAGSQNITRIYHYRYRTKFGEMRYFNQTVSVPLRPIYYIQWSTEVENSMIKFLRIRKYILPEPSKYRSTKRVPAQPSAPSPLNIRYYRKRARDSKALEEPCDVVEVGEIEQSKFRDRFPASWKKQEKFNEWSKSRPKWIHFEFLSYWRKVFKKEEISKIMISKDEDTTSTNKDAAVVGIFKEPDPKKSPPKIPNGGRVTDIDDVYSDDEDDNNAGGKDSERFTEGPKTTSKPHQMPSTTGSGKHDLKSEAITTESTKNDDKDKDSKNPDEYVEESYETMEEVSNEEDAENQTRNKKNGKNGDITKNGGDKYYFDEPFETSDPFPKYFGQIGNSINRIHDDSLNDGNDETYDEYEYRYNFPGSSRNSPKAKSNNNVSVTGGKVRIITSRVSSPGLRELRTSEGGEASNGHKRKVMKRAKRRCRKNLGNSTAILATNDQLCQNTYT